VNEGINEKEDLVHNKNGKHSDEVLDLQSEEDDIDEIRPDQKEESTDNKKSVLGKRRNIEREELNKSEESYSKRIKFD
jgi:hypothetical protein